MVPKEADIGDLLVLLAQAHPNNIYFHLIKFQTFIYSHIYSINEFEVHLTGIKAFAG